MNSIDEKKLREAKEKLACHIQPPGTHSAWAEAVAASQETDKPAETEAASQTEKIRLTQMTAAGG